jgi:superfamily II DNA helicase RecQ
MVALVRHFGDQEDSGRPCGACDVCDPDACSIRSARAPKPAEREAAAMVLESLRRRDGQATGRLHAECTAARIDRRGFEEVLGGLVRAGFLRVSADTFEKDGRTISFQRAWLTGDAKAAAPRAIEFTLSEDAHTLAGSGPRQSRGGGKKARPAPAAATADPDLVARLKKWRLSEARREGVPAFRVLHDRTLLAIAAARPQDEDALLGVPGMGPALLKRYGGQILGLSRVSA